MRQLLALTKPATRTLLITVRGHGANRKLASLTKALIQYCWAHLVRDIKFLLTLCYRSLQRWAQILLDILRNIFELYKTRHIRHYGRYKNATEKLKKVLFQKFRRSPDHREAINIKNRFIKGREKHYFLFLEREGVNPTNNTTEQAIRFCSD